MFKILEFGSLQSGWEGINEYLFLECEEIVKRGGGLYGPEFVSYNNYVIMKRAWVDPEFDLGRVLGYHMKKWSSLVNNYVDLKYLDLLRSEMASRKRRGSRSFNYAFHFSNHHGSGKDCLISLNITKRVGIEQPIIVFTVRTSEVTKRLIFDFILVQRIGEYIFGHNDFEVHLFAPSFFITAESFVMYNNVKPLHALYTNHKKLHKDEYRDDNHRFQKRVFDKYKEYMEHPNPRSIRFKVHRRSAIQIRKDDKGDPISGVKPLLVKNLQLDELPLNLPKDVITRKQINKHKRDNDTIPKP